MRRVGMPTLGPMIRAHRLGWRWSDRHGAFIRMSDAGPDHTLIELAPADGVPGGKTKGGFYRCWWEGEDVLGLIPWLRNITRVHKLISVVVDDHGTITQTRRP